MFRFAIAATIFALSSANPVFKNYGMQTNATITQGGVSNVVEIDYARSGDVTGYRTTAGSFQELGVSTGINVFEYRPTEQTCTVLCADKTACAKHADGCNQSYDILEALAASAEAGECVGVPGATSYVFHTTTTDDDDTPGTPRTNTISLEYCVASTPRYIKFDKVPANHPIVKSLPPTARLLIDESDDAHPLSIFYQVITFGAPPPASTFAEPDYCKCTSA
mmetsp:Transcript_32717/g.38468  ORF Transcript_32717/g.38468 Transcript_32717/m.38468 type:complete len:222 (-) Transcript_32717:106-771(-)